MSNDYNPFVTGRDNVDFLKALDQFRNTQETEKVRQLLEEQNRLQREANDLKKKEIALEQERIKSIQSRTGGQCKHSYTEQYSQPPVEQNTSRVCELCMGVGTAIHNVTGERMICPGCEGSGRW